MGNPALHTGIHFFERYYVTLIVAAHGRIPSLKGNAVSPLDSEVVGVNPPAQKWNPSACGEDLRFIFMQGQPVRG
jgi:hypothetical protein